MSRIDDALRRRKEQSGDPGLPAVPPRQQLFDSAWHLRTAVPDRRDAGARQILPVARVEADDHRSAGLITFSSRWRERLATGSQADPELIEQFRRLAATLHHAQQASGLNSVMVTSASPGDGKSLTSVNLALVLAESYRYKVLLVDADLRRPSIPAVSDLVNGGGLSDVLRAPTERKLALLPITAGVTLLPAGQPISNSLEALTSPRMRQILDEATARFDWVILDAPPVGATADAHLLTKMVGGTLFVIHAAKTQCGDVQKAIEVIGREQILGIVLNGVEKRPGENAYYYGVARDESKG